MYLYNDRNYLLIPQKKSDFLTLARMSIFRFKAFRVDQTGTTMKVNTDGVLLGAVASAPHPDRILDIGTGTGVIGLMLAQRFPRSEVEAIEIDPLAAELAGRNVAGSAFAKRITVQAVALADFQPADPFDLIVSNPPFFLHALKNHDQRRTTSRHADVAFYTDLLGFAARWLTARGSLQLILPVPLAAWLEQRAVDEYGLCVQGVLDIRSFAGHPPIRRILAIGKVKTTLLDRNDDLVIYERPGAHSVAYQTLLKDFFLAF